MSKIPCKPFNEAECTSGKYAPLYAHYKRDGHFTKLYKTLAGNLRVFSSINTRLDGKVKRYPWYQTAMLRMRHGATVYGELYVPGQPSSAVSRALANAASRPDGTRFAGFAVDSLPADASLFDVDVELARFGIETIPFTHGGGVFPVDAASEIATFERASAVDEYGKPWEGLVFKTGNLSGWRKWKPVKTCDCVVAGFVDGKGKYLGGVGALVLSVWSGAERGAKLLQVGTARGFSDELCWEMSAYPEKYLNRVVEVAYQEVGARGKLRFARFKRFRDDKRGRDCLLGQVY